MLMDERIARTIHASLSGASSAEADVRWNDMTSGDRSPYLIAARRVLHTLRTPTAPMLAEGNAGSARDAANVWERMIYRALHETE